MTNKDYHAAEGVSSSDFSLLEESPIHFENKKLFKMESKSFDLGSLVHKMVLEPAFVGEEFVREDFDGCELNKNSNAYKEAKKAFDEECEGRCVVDVATWDKAEKMAGNIIVIAGNLFRNGYAEQSFFVDDEEFGITRKCRPDYYREDLGICIDVKTTSSVSDYEFQKAIFDYNYHRQAAYYLDTLALAGREIDRFIFIEVEVGGRNMVRVRELDVKSIALGRLEYRKLLKEYSDYLESGEANIVKGIALPDWAISLGEIKFGGEDE